MYSPMQNGMLWLHQSTATPMASFISDLRDYSKSIKYILKNVKKQSFRVIRKSKAWIKVNYAKHQGRHKYRALIARRAHAYTHKCKTGAPCPRSRIA